MIIKRFSKTLNTNAPGFIKGRKYDQDFDRLGRMETQKQMAGNELNREMRKLGNELNEGRLGKWQHTE
jgi:hypothetical protein